jgi:hypothetical protein
MCKNGKNLIFFVYTFFVALFCARINGYSAFLYTY